MKLTDYLKDKVSFLLINFMLFIVICGIMLLIEVAPGIIVLILGIWFIPLLVYMFMEYSKQKSFYDDIDGILGSLDKKYLLAEIIEEPEFIEGRFVYDLLKSANKDMHENVKKYRDMQSEYREYIETWVHQIKTPIASTRLIIENNPSEINKNINYEIKKIEEYIEQVLYYSRSNNVSRDYIIKEVSLADVVRNVIRKNSRDFINKRISVDIEAVQGTVYSDVKWLEFILNQIIGNSVKYISDKEGWVRIYSIQNDHNIVLTIEDNGVGITEKDITRVFEKGFTGESGRRFEKSTGIGLYLCKKLCDQLGLGLTLTSELGKGTKVTVIFPMGNTDL